MDNYLFSVFPLENFIDLALYQSGWEQCFPAHTFGPVAKDHYLFHYVISGTGVFSAQNAKGSSTEYHIKSGEGFMMFPQQVCSYWADMELPWEYVWIEFDGLRVKESVELAGLSPEHPVYHSRSKELREKMMEEMLYIVHHPKESPLHILGHGFLFLDYLTRSMAPFRVGKNGKIQDFYMREALAFIEQNFQNDISVEDIAAQCGLTVVTSALFPSGIGSDTPGIPHPLPDDQGGGAFEDDPISIQDIANAVGYSNPLHFSRAFKKVYGLSPRTWRNENQVARN